MNVKMQGSSRAATDPKNKDGDQGIRLSVNAEYPKRPLLKTMIACSKCSDSIQLGVPARLPVVPSILTDMIVVVLFHFKFGA
jgi:hypothetical protein